MLKLLERLGVKLPIIQAPMAGVQNSALTVAVCNAGGLGSFPCAMHSPDALSIRNSAIFDGVVSGRKADQSRQTNIVELSN